MGCNCGGKNSKQQFLYTSPKGDNKVYKTDTTGKPLMDIGTGVPTKRQGGEPFNRPTDVAVHPNGDVFVSDGFGVVHRKQASVYDVATLLPHYAGKLVAAEIKVLEQLTSSTERPYAVVLGGSKVSDKLAVIENLATKADSLVIGGGMCFTFLASQGVSVGT